MKDAARPVGSGPSLVVVGNFDGVHRGHQAVLANASARARAAGLEPLVLTFEPHPAAALGGSAPPLLTRLARKRELIARVAPEIQVRARHFDPTFAAQSPSEFASAVLMGELDARVVVVGQNFRFGKARVGDFDALASLGTSLGFETRSHELVGDETGAWSSTRIRAALAEGDVDDARRMLGRPHMVSGVVAHGDHRGTALGFPTCNLAELAEALPLFGVYGVLVDRVERDADGLTERATALARGVANVGVRPTVRRDETAPSVEVHLFDCSGDLYGATLRVHIVGRLRAEKRFAGLDALKAQIAEDARAARALLEHERPAPEARGGWA